MATSTLETVRRLMARAEHPNTPEAERELCFSRANKLMLQHAIDEHEIRAAQSESERRKPVVETWSWMDSNSEYSSYFRTMLMSVAKSARCEIYIGTDNSAYEVVTVGFKDDVAWMQTLYTNIYYTFMRFLYPKWDKEETLESNVYRFKKAGYKWIDIWNQMVEHHYGIKDLYITKDAYIGPEEYYTEELGLPIPPTKKGMDWLFRQYRKHARLIGDTEHVKTQRFLAYRLTFAQSFTDTISERLYRMIEENNKHSNLPALVAISNEVKSEFYKQFPDESPEAIAERRRQAKEARERWERERMEKLESMTPAQRNRFLEEEERERRRSIRESERYWKRHTIESDSHGARMGSKAAETVNLSRSSQVSNQQRKGIE